tara:strand:+ start:22601 stop:22858 length:258 start_codon:yes stop_codon:yes gene_type:complete
LLHFIRNDGKKRHPQLYLHISNDLECNKQIPNQVGNDELEEQNANLRLALSGVEVLTGDLMIGIWIYFQKVHIGLKETDSQSSWE